jgi:hypothetical protein
MKRDPNHSGTPVLLAVLLALMLSTPPAVADFARDLPQICGTYEEGVIVFEVDVPQVRDLTETRLEISGTQTAGLQMLCEPPYQHSAGAEVAISVRCASAPDLFYSLGESQNPGDDGAWSNTFTLWEQGALPALAVGGRIEVEFRIGDLFAHLLCTEYITLPVTTIESARISTDGVVPAAGLSWGKVKTLYR